MAKANERTEREFLLDVNQAVAQTEDEIFNDALGNEELDNDGDTSLEEMGEGLEGDDIEEDAEAEEDEAEEAEADEGEESEEDDAEEPAEAEAKEEQQPQRGRSEPRVPPSRLREEAAARRAAETEAAELRRQLAEMNGRLTEISARVNAPQRAEPKQEPKADPEPDMFADPEGWKAWNRRQAEQVAEAKINDRFTSFQQQQQQERETLLNDNLSAAASGQRGLEFQAAYRALTSLPKDAQSRALVGRLVSNPYTAADAILEWFQENGAEEWRADMARQLGLTPPQPTRGAPNNSRRMSPQPRHETRLPPSLNSARGGGRQQIQDPEMLDDSDDAVMRYALR